MFKKFFQEWLAWSVQLLSNQRGDIRQIFTPPKSKSPFEAATAGSTGGLFKFAAPSKNPFVGQLLTGLSGAIPGIGPFLSTALGASGALGGGTGFQGTDRGFAGNILPTILGGAGGFGAGKLGKGFFNLGATGGFQGAANAISRFGAPGAAGGSIFQKAANALGRFGQPGTAGPLAAAGGPLTAGGGGFPPGGAGGPLTFEGFQAATKGLGGATGGGGNPFLDFFRSDIGKTLIGSGISALGRFGPGQAPGQVPRSPFFGEISSRLLQGTPLSRFATEELTKVVGRPAPEFAPISDKVFEAATRRSVEEEKEGLEAFRTEFKGIRPGANIQNDSDFRRGIQDIRQKSRSERDALRTELAFNREQEFFAREERFFENKINNLRTVLDLDLAQIQQFAQLAALDQEVLIAQFGLDSGQAARFQELFGDIGEFFVRQGTKGNPLNRFQQTQNA